MKVLTGLALAMLAATWYPASAQEDIEQMGRWYYRASLDPITDANSSVAGTTNDQWLLGIQCADGDYNVGVVMNDALLRLKVIGETWRPAITWRVDQDEPVTEEWTPIEYGLGAVWPQAGKFVEAVALAKNRVVMRFSHSAAMYTVVLAVDGAPEAIGALNHCRSEGTNTPSFRERAAAAAMKSDLRNLVTTQEAHFADHGTYGSTIEQIDLARMLAPGVTIALSDVSKDGYRGTAHHASLPNVTCYIEIGSAWQKADGTYEGAPWCDN